MTIQEFIDRVSRRLRDVDKRQWTQDYLVEAADAAFNALTQVLPQSYTVSRDITLAEGVRQTLDDDLHRIIHLDCNVCPVTGTEMRNVTLIDMSVMDRQFSHWRRDKKRGYAAHYMLNSLDESEFYVWPPVYGPKADVVPTAVAQPVDPGPVGGSVTQQDVDDYNAALVLYNQYLADLETFLALPGGETLRGVFSATPCIKYPAPTAVTQPVDPGPVVAAVAATFDPATADIPLSANGSGDPNLVVSTASSSTTSAEITAVGQGLTSGKYVWGIQIDSGYAGLGQRAGVGITSVNVDDPAFGGGSPSEFVGNNDMSYGYYGNGEVYFNSVITTTSTAYNNGDVVYQYLDLDAGTYSVQINSGPIVEIVSGLTGAWWPAVSMRELFSSTYQYTALFSDTDLGIAVPTGFDTFGTDAVTQTEVDTYLADLEDYNAYLALQLAFDAKEGFSVDEELPFDKAHIQPLIEFACYYCHIRDDEQTANSGRAMQHWQNFFQLLNKREDSELTVKTGEQESEL